MEKTKNLPPFVKLFFCSFILEQSGKCVVFFGVALHFLFPSFLLLLNSISLHICVFSSSHPFQAHFHLSSFFYISPILFRIFVWKFSFSFLYVSNFYFLLLLCIVLFLFFTSRGVWLFFIYCCRFAQKLLSLFFLSLSLFPVFPISCFCFSFKIKFFLFLGRQKKDRIFQCCIFRVASSFSSSFSGGIQ